jgi:hypothetical protein
MSEKKRQILRSLSPSGKKNGFPLGKFVLGKCAFRRHNFPFSLFNFPRGDADLFNN